MNTSQTLPFDKPQTERRASPDSSRLFYSGAAAFLLILMFLGFQQFYLRGRAFPDHELTPPIRVLLILHGVGMTAWMMLFLVQPLLIVAGNRRLHMMLGRVGALLAACVFFLGFRVGIEATRVNPPDMRFWGLAPKEFMAVPIIAILMFAGFVLAGIWNRRQPAVHRPMMLLAVLAVMPAPIDRIDAIQSLYRDTIWGTIFGPFFSMLVIGLFFLVAKRLLTRSWDWWLAMGWAGLVAASVLAMQLATTSAWDRIASFLLR